MQLQVSLSSSENFADHNICLGCLKTKQSPIFSIWPSRDEGRRWLRLDHCDHRLNKSAPSKIEVFEKEKGQWVLTEKVSLNDFFSLTEMIRFQKPVHLRSERSDVKLGISVYHCPEDHKGLCVIDDFEGLIKRTSSKLTSEVMVSIQGTDPKKY